MKMFFKFILFFIFLILLNHNNLCTAKLQELFIDVPIDQFSFSKNNDTFKLRYLLNDDYYVKGGPIFFYCGNEADITTFYENTGFIFDIAPTFNALIVFAEHRYYGQSMPFGGKSLTVLENMKYLTTSQALADFVCLIDFLCKKYYSTMIMINNNTYPVIAFGGSYGGMLAAWLRMKYPHVVLGSIAASAPLLQINNLELCESFYKIVTESFTKNGNCSQQIKSSWQAIRNLTATTDGKKNATEIFKLCKKIETQEDIDKLIDGIADIYVNLAMLNYPYPTNFLTPLPAHPVKAFCDKLNSFGHQVMENNSLIISLKALSNALEIATNYSGKIKCNNFEITPNNQPIDYAWNFQACFELVMPMCATKDDMFELTKWNFLNYSKECTEKYKIIPYSSDGGRVLRENGGKILKYASNIVFSNGLIDPWYSGGILQNISESVVAVLIPEAAHHYDLRGANPVDSKYVIDARKFHINQIRKWLNT